MDPKKKYRFKPYSKRYPELFRREKARLRKILGKSVNIYHIGSTAVPGMGGKGIIDVQLSCPKGRVLSTKGKLEKNGYHPKTWAHPTERFFFWKDYKYAGKERRVHIQLTCKGSRAEKEHLAFAQCLRTNKTAFDKYYAIKQKASRLAKGEKKVYRKTKQGLIYRLTRKAMK